MLPACVTMFVCVFVSPELLSLRSTKITFAGEIKNVDTCTEFEVDYASSSKIQTPSLINGFPTALDETGQPHQAESEAEESASMTDIENEWYNVLGGVYKINKFAAITGPCDALDAELVFAVRTGEVLHATPATDSPEPLFF